MTLSFLEVKYRLCRSLYENCSLKMACKFIMDEKGGAAMNTYRGLMCLGQNCARIKHHYSYSVHVYAVKPIHAFPSLTD